MDIYNVYTAYTWRYMYMQSLYTHSIKVHLSSGTGAPSHTLECAGQWWGVVVYMCTAH